MQAGLRLQSRGSYNNSNASKPPKSTNQSYLLQPNASHLRNVVPGRTIDDKILNMAQKELQLRSSGYSSRFLNPEEKSGQLPAIKPKQPFVADERFHSTHQSPTNKDISLKQSSRQMKRNSSQGLIPQQIEERPVSRESEVERILNMRQSQSMKQLQPLQTDTQSYASGGDTGSMKVFQRNYNSQTRFKHPVSGEELSIDREDLMKNTQKSPFQNSVRDSTNFYFGNSKALENLYDLQNANQKTFNRRLKIKNSYMTIFPMYGLQKNTDMFKSTQYQSIGTQLEKADEVDHEFFNKMDYWKKYNEEMLKAKNMRMKKR